MTQSQSSDSPPVRRPYQPPRLERQDYSLIIGASFGIITSSVWPNPLQAPKGGE